MVLDKTAGAVGCSHCKCMGASEHCERCGQLVCAACLTADNCTTPGPVELRLGMGSRLREVDATGCVGVASWWSGGGRVVSLETGRDLAHLSWWRAGTSVDTFTEGGHWPLFVSPDRLLWIRSEAFKKPRLMTLTVGDDVQREHRVEGWRRRGETCLVAVTKDGRRGVAVRSDHKVVVLDLVEFKVIQVLGEKRQIIQSCAVSSAMGLIAVGGFRKAAFYQLEDLERMGSCEVGEGEVDWIGLGGGRAAMFCDDGHLEVVAVDPARPPHNWPVVRRADLGGGVRPVADLSPDGQLLARRVGRRQVEVMNLDSGGGQLLSSHTDDVVLVRFVDGGRRLITADEDNRVIIWPREAERIVV